MSKEQKTIKAKFQCLSVTRFHSSEVVEFKAVTSENESNKSWSKWTPAGELKMTITNPAIFSHFEPGVNYYLDIVRAVPQL